MFRKEALRKGVLKTINANVGIMVGQSYGGPTAYNPNRLPVVIPGQGTYNTPKPSFGSRMKGFGRKLIGDVKNFPSGAITDPKGTIKGTRPLGMGGGISRLLGFEGLYSAVDPYVGQYIQNPYGRMAVSSGLSLLGSLNPYIRGAGVAKSVYDMGKAGLGKIGKDTAEYRAKPIGEKTLFSRMGDDEAGVFIPSIEREVESDKKIVQGRPGGRVGFENRAKELKAEGDPLLQDNVSTDDIANLDAVQENAVNIDSTGMPPGPPGSTDSLQTASTEKVDSSLTKQEKTTKPQSTDQGTNEINVGGPTNDTIFNQRIELAKKYTEELEKGQSSQAKLVFLANLASGLLTGTTKKSGIGGAMEVFGQAIGPAVNNYATIKLKEGELRAGRREAGLNAAFDHMKFLNDAAKGDVETVERDRGVVQIRGVDGKLRNYKAYTRKDGTIEMASGGFDKNTGKEVFVPVVQGSDIKTSGPDGIPGNEDDKVIGKYEDFIPQKIYSKRLQEIEDILGNRYAALATTRDVLKTLAKTDADNEQVRAGASLSIDTFFRRATGVAKDILGVDLASDGKEAEAQAEQFYQDEMNKIQDALDSGEITESQASSERKLIDKSNLKNNKLEKIKKKGAFSGLSGADQEKLAVQEVTLVYALANTFKDQDRLTQRDINAAQKIVNIFSLARSSQDVRDSINAIGNQLEADINRQEIAYTRSGGLDSSLMDLRAQQNFEPFKEGQSIPQGLQTEFDTEEKIKNELEGIGL